MMTTNQIRDKFLKFFQSKHHTIIASDSLVPKNDPTVLFTTAGMQQFKQQFLGFTEGYTKATSSQKCMRTDDLDEVGRTDFHHTFFEMLGNFSFGDYFKKEAIAWAWEFLTEELNIPKERLWVSVYKDDDEAENIWINDIKMPKEKIFKLGDKSNFWPSNAKLNGPNGPCGPCSEIFYDYNPDAGTVPTDPDDEPGRFCEVWNLVFTQFNRKDGGELEPLPNKNIDTGMGLERLVSVIQGKKNNFETDIFAPIIKSIDAHISITESTADRNLRYVIADHIRAIVIGISDGIIPSNKERGSVIRKLIIEISDIAIRNGQTQPVIYKLVDSVVEAMNGACPELKEKTDMIAGNIESVEKAFIKVRQERIPEFEKNITEHIDNINKIGEILFTFKDRYGLTLSTMETILKNKISDNKKIKESLTVYQNLMKQQQEQSRASSKMQGDVFVGDDQLDLDVPKTDFLGYEHAESTSQILRIFINNEKLNKASKGDRIKIILDKTPFYAESGGQVADIGVITKDANRIVIEDVQKTNDIFIHSGYVAEGTFEVDQVVHAEIDVDRRLSIMRNHTATHLLQAALRDILGEHVQQQGSLVDNERLRFDFTHHQAIGPKELSAIESLVNVFIRSCDAITTEYLSKDQAKNSGALAFFAEKYGDTVRVVSIGNYSKEFCGGTHLGSTGQIGIFKIVQESAIAQGIRRLEAKTGISANEYINEQQALLEKIAKTLKAPVNEVLDRVNKQGKRIKDLEKAVEDIQFESIKASVDNILQSADSLNGTKIVTHSFKNVEMGLLRKVSDIFKKKTDSSVIVLGASADESASILITVSDDLIKRDIKANDLIKDIAPLINGSGGGRPQLAQAGSKESAKVDAAVKQANVLIKEKIQR